MVGNKNTRKVTFATSQVGTSRQEYNSRPSSRKNEHVD